VRTEFDPAELEPRAFYHVLTALIIPRPIAWVSSLAPDGTANLAPHSFFTVSCVDPPVIQFTSVGRKDSLSNIEATGEFVVNMTPEALIEQVNSTGTNFPADVDEFAVAGLEPEPSARVRPPRVAASPAALECTLHSTLSLGDSTIVFGNVVHAAVATDVLDGGRPDARLLRPLGRLSGSEWSRPGEVVRIERVPYERWREQRASAVDGG
jgi:flavin reductase (DIM6/NTAB) family NADH-FMN oxidoreductase RutF